jgi:ABC-type transport system involved in multi-copper enzyme maturation permease subunit
MNALIHKEVRSILPAWALAMVLATLPVWIVWPGPGGVMFQDLGLLVFAPFGLGVLLLSITPFGQELNWGTFSVLLSQPVPRHRLWLVKTVVLAVALSCAFVAFCISNHIRVDSAIETMKNKVWRNEFNHPGVDNQYFVKLIADARRSASQDTLLTGGLTVLAGFGGGLWTTLLFRQVTAAFWLTGLVPLGLGLLTGKILGDFPDAVAQSGVGLVLGAYSAAGFVWAKRMFLQVQDTQWTGGVIALPQWNRAGAAAGSGAAGRERKPMRALLRKEFQAQHVNLLLAGGLLVLHLAVVLLRRLSADYLASHHSVAMTVEEFPRLWLVMPLLVGSVAIAEERKLGTLESSLCLPATRRLQFVTKLVVVLVLGLVLGAILPLFVEHFAGLAGLRGNPTGLFFLGETRTIWLLQLAGASILTGLALYGSTLTRNSLQAMGAGLMTTVIACLVIFVAGHAGGSQEIILWAGPLVEFIGSPVMVTTLVVLAYFNFSVLQPDGRTWLRNGLTVLVSLACVAGTTTAVYHRAWEAWLPEEPHHGWAPSIYARTPGQVWVAGTEWPGSPPKLRASSFRRAAVLPDGRLWLNQRQAQIRENQGIVQGYATGPLHTGFVAGTNWRDIAVADSGCFGIQTDGSLWDLSELQVGEGSPKRIGPGQDWQTISAGGQHFCALKSDGTIWEWGEQENAVAGSAAGQNLAPAQVGTDTDWAAVCSSWETSAAMKSDGSIWRWREVWWDNVSKTRIYDRARQPQRRLASPCGRPRSIALRGSAVAAVCEDGTLWIGGFLTNSQYARLVSPEQTRAAATGLVRWGNDTDWREITFGGWGKAIGIKRDGTLWQWTLAWYGNWEGWVIPPTMPSQYMDWVCAGSDNRGFLALARDGSLCLWGDPEERLYYGRYNPDDSSLLMPSRIKARRIADLSR